MVIERMINGMDVIVMAEYGSVWLLLADSSIAEGSIEISSILPKGRGMTLIAKIESIMGELVESLSTVSLEAAA